MATLHNFSRSLEPIRDFDDGGLSGDCESVSLGGEVVPYCDSNASSWKSSDIILTAFIDYHCSVYEQTQDRQDKLYHSICKELQKANILKSIKLSSSFRRQMRDGFNQFFHSIRQDLEVASTSSINQQSLLPFISVPRQPLIPQPSINLVIESIHQSSKLLSEFENIKPIEGAKGACGEVFVVKKKSDGVEYAVKKIKYFDDVIKREVEILARLSHPNIVRYYDSWDGLEFVPPDSDSEDESYSYTPPVQGRCRRKGEGLVTSTHVLYIQMELCTCTLKDWLSERLERGINYDESYQIAKQILKGVEFIHAENYFHRDLKPLNIFLSKNSTSEVPNIKIGDFGLARKIFIHDINNAGTQEIHFTADVGTPHYGAPEQLNGTVYSEKSDMFSIGLILYELYYLFGTDMEKMHVFTKLRENEEIDGEFSKSRPVEALWIRRLTAKNPDVRPSADEVLKDLRKHKSSQGASAELLKDVIRSQGCELQDLKRQLSEKNRLLVEKDQQISILTVNYDAAQKDILELKTLLQQAKLVTR